jgi:hypothetical protein
MLVINICADEFVKALFALFKQGFFIGISGMRFLWEGFIEQCRDMWEKRN